MLDKLVIHLKNIIFFKVVIYILFIVLLAATIPNFRDELIKSEQRKTKAEEFLLETQLALQSISEFEKEITATNIKYKKLIKNSGQKGCLEREKLLLNLKKISSKHNLSKTINVKIARLFKNNSNRRKNDEVKLNEHQVNISFNSHSWEKALEITQEICNILPSNTLITGLDIKKIQVLTPEIVKNISFENPSGLIDTSLKIILREIIYEK